MNIFEEKEKTIIKEDDEVTEEEKKQIIDRFEKVKPVVEDLEVLRRVEDLEGLYHKYYPKETLPDDSIKKLEKIKKGLKKIGEHTLLVDLIINMQDKLGISGSGQSIEQRKTELKKVSIFTLVAIAAQEIDEGGF